MKTIKNYNIYIFMSTFTRNIIDVYSVIYLYKFGFSFNDIIIIYAYIYFFGYFISNLCIRIGNKIGYKYILIMSSVFTSISFYILHNSYNLYLISLFLSLSMFTYHPIRHYFGIKLLQSKETISNNLIYIYLANLLSSYLAIKNINLIYLMIISIISIIPTLFIGKDKYEIIKYSKIPSYKLKFFFFDQFRIIFILFEPLYLYMISNTISYVGIFNIILTLASIAFLYLFVRKMNTNKDYKYLNFIFVIILLLKLNTSNKVLLLIVAFFEGIGIKINELVSTLNFYDGNKLNIGYIIICEKIFCVTRFLILVIIYFLSFNIKIILYLLVVGIFILSFMYEKKDTVT